MNVNMNGIYTATTQVQVQVWRHPGAVSIDTGLYQKQSVVVHTVAWTVSVSVGIQFSLTAPICFKNTDEFWNWGSN